MKQTKYLYSLLLAILFTQAGFAQNETSRFIDVHGSAEMEVTPDIIKLSINLREYEQNKKLVTLEQIETGFLKAVKESGLEEDQVVVTRVSSNAYNTKRKRKAFASKAYEITFSDQIGLLNFTSRLKNTDISYMNISHLGHTKMTDYRLEVKKQALIAAKKKAKVLVEAVDGKLGHVITIKEEANYTPWEPRNIAMSNMVMRQKEESNDIEADEIGFKKIKLRFEINARFAIQ